MATLRDIRRKIASVRSTQTITRTMRMISVSKLRRSQDQLEKITGYATRIDELLRRVAGRAPEGAHPLLAPRQEAKRVLLFAIASDRGLAGAFNLNIAGAVEDFIEKNRDVYETIRVYLVGKKLRDYFRKRAVEIDRNWVDVRKFDDVVIDEMAGDMIRRYVEGEYDKVYLVYTYFHSAARYEVVLRQFLPITVEAGEQGLDYLYEPGTAGILEELAPHYVRTRVEFALAESQTSEHAARMAAMENATNSCGDMITYLTLVYNKTRQQSITSEMMDIVGGAEALQST